MLTVWACVSAAWALILLLIPTALPVALILTGLSGAAVTALYGADYPVAYGLAVASVLEALAGVWLARTRFSDLRRLYLLGSDDGAVLGAPSTPGDHYLEDLALKIVGTTAGAWSATRLQAGETTVQLVFVGCRVAALVDATAVVLPSGIIAADWQRVAAAVNAGDLVRLRKTLSSHGFAPSLFAVTGPTTRGSETVVLEKSTRLVVVPTSTASAVVGSTVVPSQPVVVRRPVRMAAAVNALRA